MIQINQIFNCANSKLHKDDVWVRMVVGQFEPDRRVSLHCPECRSCIVVDLDYRQGRILTSLAAEEEVR